jgi:hypothetical protein
MKRALITIVITLGSVAGLAQNVTPAMKSSADVAIVVNGKNGASDISSSELASMLLGERRFWTGKAPVQLVLRQPGNREFDLPIAKLLKMSPADFRQNWKMKVFRGEAASEPTYVPSSGLAAQFSRDQAGVLTLVAAHDLPPDAKVLKLDGKLPGDTGYPLR